MTESDDERTIRRIAEGKLVVLRTPPWPCPHCDDDTITLFEWLDDGTIKATCKRCKEAVYS
jgi:hypothetical protein